MTQSATPHPASYVENLQLVLAQSLAQYSSNRNGETDEEWLLGYLANELPDMPEAERNEVAQGIVGSTQAYAKKRNELDAAESNGMSREGWLAREIEKGSRTMTTQGYGEYLQNIDEAITRANEDLSRTLLKVNGEISRNPNLDGYYFEADQTASFNMDAALKNKGARAEVLRPEPGKSYAKDSADIAVQDANGNVVKEYQAKCYADANKSNAAFEKGNYENQEKLVPKGHENGDSTSVLSHDNVESKPMSKEGAKEVQRRVQEDGELPGKSWDDYSNRELAIQMGRQACIAGLQGAALGATFHVVGRLMEGDEVDVEGLARDTVYAGVQAGATCAVAGALKVFVEKHVASTPCIPSPYFPSPFPIPRNPVALGMIASLAIDSCKTAYKVAEGEMTVGEACLEMERNACSVVAGTLAYVKGAEVGATIGCVLGPWGAVVGGFVGGITAGMAGSAIARKVAEGCQAIRSTAVNIVKTTCEKIYDTASSCVLAIRDLFSW